MDQIVNAHPNLTKEGVRAALEYAAETLRADIVQSIP
ncbi:MAG: hypothetical protein ACRELU_13695 [Gemmatimonadota bacterium]